MRVAYNMFYNHLTQGLRDTLSELDNLSSQIATGKKMIKPSDDVLGTMKAMDYKLTLSQNAQAQQNITEATNYLNFDNAVLTQVSDSFLNLKTLTNQIGGTAADRTNYASQAATLRDNLLDISNSTYLNSYIFSGSLSDQPSYVYDGVNNEYVYQGNNQQMSISLGSGITAKAINVVGNSPDATILTPFHYALAAVETITLSDGNIVTLTPDVLTRPNSTIINVQVTDPSAVVLDNFSFSNVMDMANLISHAWNYQDVDGVTAITDQQSMNRIEALANTLDKIQTQLLTVQGQIGINQVQISGQKTRLDYNTLAQENNLSAIQDADMDETIVSLQKMSTSLSALRSATAKILSQSLFDFLG
jgi:flagellar hook-associated protein 3 FlgL